MSLLTKRCENCHKEKDLLEFNYTNKSLGRRRASCKKCQSRENKKLYKANKPQKIEAAKQYQLKNKEKYLAYQDLYNKTKRKRGVKPEEIIIERAAEVIPEQESVISEILPLQSEVLPIELLSNQAYGAVLKDEEVKEINTLDSYYIPPEMPIAQTLDLNNSLIS